MPTCASGRLVKLLIGNNSTADTRFKSLIFALRMIGHFGRSIFLLAMSTTHHRWRRLPKAPKNTFAKRRAPWSTDDDETLVEYYTTHGAIYTAAILSRTVSSVNSRASSRGIPGFGSLLYEDVAISESLRKEQDDTDIDERFIPTINVRKAILAMIGHHEVDEIAAQYKTTPTTIRAIARDAGLIPRLSTEQWTAKEDRTIKTQWNRKPASVIARELNRSDYAVKVRAAALGLVRTPRAWTSEEDAYLIEHGREHKAEDIARQLGRTDVATRQRLRHLGIRWYRPSPSSAFWTEREIATLRSLYDRLSVRDIATKLGRSEPAVTAKAQSLGLSPRHWLPHDDALLRELYGNVPNREIEQRLGRTRHAVITRINALGLARAKHDAKLFYDKRHDKTLRKLYGTIPDEELAKRVGVSRETLRTNLLRLGLREAVENKYTAAEDRYLRKTYATRPLDEVAEHLGRSIDSIRNRARVLGLKRPKPHPDWTADEIEYLRKNYHRKGIQELMAAMGRTRESIKSHAQQFGLRKPGYVPGGNAELKWTAKQQQFIRENYSTMSMTEMARRLGRTIHQVSQKAHKMGLAPEDGYYMRVARWSPDDDRMLRKLFGTMPRRKIAERMGRTPIAITGRCNELGLRKSDLKKGRG